MTLHVPIDRFPETAKRVLDSTEAYVAAHSGGAVATACSVAGTTLVRSFVKSSVEETMNLLRESGFEVYEGAWSHDEGNGFEPDDAGAAYVAAVAYESDEDKPGLWIDAYGSAPTPMQVLKSLFDEFRDTGELDEISFEEFVRQANPNVVIVSPSELQSFLTQKDGC
jgi:hypothetical protein